MFNLFINGKFYGQGSPEYVTELIREYSFAMGMYGNKEVVFKIQKSVTGRELH